MPVRRRHRLLLCGLTLVVSLGSGCRLFNKSGGESGAGGSGTRDPLFGRDRIPATDLPTGRENARGRRDPLLVSPSKDDEKLSSDLPSDGRREPFRTGPNTTAAGLARGESSDPLLAVPGDDRRPRGGPVMLKGNSESTSSDRALDDLKRLGVKVGEPIREGSEYVLRGEREASDGIRRRYEASGSTPAAAAQDLLEQVRSERNN